ncbi:hypothetical protein COOONC_19673, partial [Cooperia oncophora]
GIVEYAEICKLARKSIQEDLRQRHIQIFRQAIKSGRLRRGRMQALHARRSLTILKETTSSPPSDPSPSDEPFPDHVSQSVKAVRNFYNALYHSSFGPPTPPSGQINLQVYNNEVQMAMKRSKARSAAGSDGIQSPSLRALSQILALPITHFFNNMIRTRLCLQEKSILPPEQAGFRKHFSTIDHIHTINMITEKCHEFNIELCAVFVDFKKAFDSVELPMIWKALEHFGVEENLIMAIQLLYAHSTAAVRIANQLAEFNLQRGVRQGDSMSPVLFTLVLQYALNLIDWQGKGLKLGNKTLSYLAYADDIYFEPYQHTCSLLAGLRRGQPGLAASIKPDFQTNSLFSTPSSSSSESVKVEVEPDRGSDELDSNFTSLLHRFTALHYAAKYGHVKAVELLLNRGANS